MALYDGFFDAVKNEETGEYDRAYSSGDFTGYYANVIGSGVCIHDNPDSFLVRLEDGDVIVSPGYLFIQGYWLKNDADYTVELPTAGTYAIVAHLNRGQRLIEIEARSVAQAYPDALVLAIVSPTSAEDTRHNTDICGTIDTAGELSGKVEWALNYIDNEIESKLAEVKQTILAQERRLDAKIAQVQAVAASIVPPPIGSIKFSASEDVGDEWLRCDGSFINEADYPDLVAALGKLIPSGDKFQLLSSGEIGPQITNGAVYGGRMWVYSYSTKKLYGVDLAGTATVKEITLSSEESRFNDFITPTTAKPLCLSIVPHTSGSGAKLFLTQIIQDGGTVSESTDKQWLEYFLIFQSEFTGEENSLSMTVPFTNIITYGNTSSTTVTNCGFSSARAIPYVALNMDGGIAKYVVYIGCAKFQTSNKTGYYCSLIWAETDETANLKFLYAGSNDDNTYFQRAAYSNKNRGELVIYNVVNGLYKIKSSPNSIFYVDRGTFLPDYTIPNELRSNYGPLNIVGNSLITAFDKNKIPFLPIEEGEAKNVNPGLSLPSAARIFVDGGAYLWGKDIYMIFVGTGIIFSRTLAEGDFGYLDTTDVLGTITQFGYLDYSVDEGTLYLLGQDTTNTVKVAKIVLNTLYDYANDGAWLPMIASDGVPAYIKATGDSGGGGAIPDPVPMQITVTIDSSFASNGELLFNDSILSVAGTFTRNVSASGTFTVGVRRKTSYGPRLAVKMNGTEVVYISSATAAVGAESTTTFNTADFIANGITLQGTT